MAIPHNVGTIDRVVRFITGILLIYIGFIDTDIIPDQVFSMLVGIFGIVNLATAAMSWCPLYHLIHLDTTGNSDS